MTDRLTRHRSWIALLYGLVVVLAHGFHAHEGPVAIAGCETSDDPCGDEHPAEAANQFFWDQDENSSCTTTTGCLSCDFSLSHQGTLADQPLLVEPVWCPHFGRPPVADLLISASWARTRAPPLS
ncbi:hypothetical protein [Tautonia rosea]|uniref:hypothetical protein n=1 Tax=Tautonia rosea TaxID=2728037 RepID=UPI001474F9DD|nr:hypothetical protein [Tautonia rosea]